MTPVQPKKEVTFDKSEVPRTASVTLDMPHSTSAPPFTRDTTKMTEMTRETTKITEEDVMKVPGEIPIIQKRQRPSSGQQRPSSAGKGPPKPMSSKKDSSIVLSYLKKNMYDDTGK